MMKMRILLVASALLVTLRAFAHHSVAMFDNGALVVLKGVVVTFSYVNPHVWISIQGSPDGTGEAARWDIEATSPSTLARIGIAGDALKSGDPVTIAMRPLRDGRRGGSMVFVITPDGISHGANPSELGLHLEDLKPGQAQARP
ncbi:MAG TPA: DUF6152 family protein [Candidatus Acidoferrum sp.]|nr:DUF6152 family protein [Candidatus Acidoferrum sp.]